MCDLDILMLCFAVMCISLVVGGAVVNAYHKNNENMEIICLRASVDFLRWRVLKLQGEKGDLTGD